MWPDDYNVCLIFGHLQHELTQKHAEFSKIDSKVWQILIRPSKSCQIFKFCQSGEISPNHMRYVHILMHDFHCWDYYAPPTLPSTDCDQTYVGLKNSAING